MIRRNPKDRTEGMEGYLKSRRVELVRRARALDVLEEDLAKRADELIFRIAKHDRSLDRGLFIEAAGDEQRPNWLRGLASQLAAGCVLSAKWGTPVGPAHTLGRRIMRAAGAATQEEEDAWWEGWTTVTENPSEGEELVMNEGIADALAAAGAGS